MITDFININKNNENPLYVQIYNGFKNAIENGKIKEDEKIPSVRKLSGDLGVSKTTVENAYGLLLADGYIYNIPQKGYYIEKGIAFNKLKTNINKDNKPPEKFKYDFSGKGIDKNCTNIKEWRKYIKNVLNKEYLLNTYSESQGEVALRKSISKYTFSTRGAYADYTNIVIGSGSQTLIYILCGMLGINKTIAMEKNTFPQAEQVFKDFNYKIKYVKSDSKGITVNSLKEIKADVLLLNPNFISTNGSTMPIKRKIEILKWANDNNCLIIEDDYNGELRYISHPKTCIQSYSPNTVVYIGSFSKILLPSVRISYMILPESLISEYYSVKENYNQTTSKIEQLALSDYISDGKLEKYLRKLRRYYFIKSEYMKNELSNYFDSFIFNETSMYFEIDFDKPVLSKIKKRSIKPMSTSTDKNIKLNFSQIEQELISGGIKEIYDVYSRFTQP